MLNTTLCLNWFYKFCTFTGLKFDMSSSTDLTEADLLGHKNNYIQVYSNSWGPSDWGFIVNGPGTLALNALKTGVREVHTNFFKLIFCF